MIMKINRRHLIGASFIICHLSFSAALAQAQAPNAELLRKLNMAEMTISHLYVDSVDENKLEEDAIRGMLEKLDPHSAYSTPK
jgi:carboxyl-terminal processing protease